MRWEWERWDEGDGFLGMDGLEWSGKNLDKEVHVYLTLKIIFFVGRWMVGWGSIDYAWVE